MFNKYYIGGYAGCFYVAHLQSGWCAHDGIKSYWDAWIKWVWLELKHLV